MEATLPMLQRDTNYKHPNLAIHVLLDITTITLTGHYTWYPYCVSEHHLIKREIIYGQNGIAYKPKTINKGKGRPPLDNAWSSKRDSCWKETEVYYKIDKRFTYCTRSFQSDKKACNPRLLPKMPELLRITVSKLAICQCRITLFILTMHFKRRHTEENSKAQGYIRKSCETQSTHCKQIKRCIRMKIQ